MAVYRGCRDEKVHDSSLLNLGNKHICNGQMSRSEVISRAKRCTYRSNRITEEGAENPPGEREKFPLSMRMIRGSLYLAARKVSWVRREEQGRLERMGEEGEFGI